LGISCANLSQEHVGLSRVKPILDRI